MPNYNDATTIGRAIEAIMRQSTPPDKFLIIDDCSTDNSIITINTYIHKYPQIKLIRHNKNMGVIASLQEGWQSLDTDYVYGASADDYVLPGFFEQAMNLVYQYPKAGIVFGDMVTVNEKDEKISIASVRKWKTARFAPPTVYLTECLEIEPPSHSWSASTIYRRSALQEIAGFPLELGPCSDIFAIRAIGLKHGVCYSSEKAVAWRLVEKSFSGELRYDIKQYFSSLKLATQKMRTGFYRDIFPEKYVRKWHRRYRLYIVARYIISFVL